MGLDLILQNVFGKRNVLFHGGPNKWHWHCDLDSNYEQAKPIKDIFIDYYKKGLSRDVFTHFLKEYGFWEDVIQAVNDEKK